MNYTELYKYINSLFNKYFNKYRMRIEDKQDVIQNCILKLYLKEQEGVLSSDIEKNKNYIFITIKNEIYNKSYLKKNLIDFVAEFKEDMILTHPTIEQEIDKGIRYKQLKSIFKSNDFSSNEKQLLFHILSGKEAASLSVELQMDKKEIYRTYSNLKAKLKTRVSSKPKYLLIYPTGKTFTMKTKKELCEQTGFCIDTLNQYLSIGKLKHKNFTIVIN